MHQRHAQAIILFAALILIASCAHAQTTTFGNSHVEFVFENTSTNFYLKEIRDLDEGHAFTLNDHPLWTITGILPTTLQPLPVDEVGVPTVQEETINDGKRLTLAWNDLGAAPELIDVRLVFELDDDEGIADLYLQVENDITSYYFESIDFHLHIPASASENDYAVTPWRGGHEIKSPAANMIPYQYGTSFRVPFQGSMQLFPYYTESGKGIYVASEDEDGHFKRIEMFGNGNELHYRFRQEVPGIFTPGIDYTSPYPIKLGVFKGKWFEAAQIYRKWAVQQEWVQKGKLETRNDIPTWIKETHLITASNGDVSITSTQWVNAYTQLKQYFDLNYLGVWWQGWFTDATFMNPNPGMNATTTALKNANIFSFPYIHSSARAAATPSTAFDNARVLQLNGNPIELQAPYTNAFVLNPSQSFTRDSFAATALSAAQNGSMGIYWDVPEEYPDYSTNRSHLPGGGDYFTQGNRQLLQGMRNAMKQIDSRAGVLFPEAAQEDYIDVMDFMMTDFISAPITPQNQLADQFIPLFQTVYHDYILTYLSADRLYSMGVNNPNDYDAVHAIGFTAGNILASREDCFIEGIGNSSPVCQAVGAGMLTTQMPLLQEHVQFMKSMIDARKLAKKFLVYGRMMKPPALDAGTQIYTFTDSAFVPREVDKQVKIANVLVSVWKSNDNEIGIVLTNHTPQERNVTFTLNFSSYGISGTKHAYLMQENGDAFLETYTNSMQRSETLPPKSVRIIRLSSTPYVPPLLPLTIQLTNPSSGQTFYGDQLIPFQADATNPSNPGENATITIFLSRNGTPGTNDVIKTLNQSLAQPIQFDYDFPGDAEEGMYYYRVHVQTAQQSAESDVRTFTIIPRPETCGNQFCATNESCNSCPQDCGACPTPEPKPTPEPINPPTPPKPTPIPTPTPVTPADGSGWELILGAIVVVAAVGGAFFYTWPRLRAK
ncbi:MAG: hypothetical protein IPJ89_00700 [Candidatus Iainarchaeum archaeon]|uniref:DUF6259 domain-containing protein n=1 Tax=Candidatus Iainarchaeum sp. TaxID=3101447 RepID=A0A7T9DK00_9ARCH|nr:MAG: hypothetical protein IPJ89_00700 [Candidatus Diapherotrites archaeon]